MLYILFAPLKLYTFTTTGSLPFLNLQLNDRKGLHSIHLHKSDDKFHKFFSESIYYILYTCQSIFDTSVYITREPMESFLQASDKE